MPSSSTPIIGVVAASGTGKTRLLVALIPHLKALGLRVGAIKRSHHDVEVDVPGKDSHALRQAGAAVVMLSSPRRRMLVTEYGGVIEPDLERDLAGFDATSIDLILVEGYREAPFPKLEVHRQAVSSGYLFPQDPNIIAVVTDGPPPATELPVLNLNAPDDVAQFIYRRLDGGLA